MDMMKIAPANTEDWMPLGNGIVNMEFVDADKSDEQWEVFHEKVERLGTELSSLTFVIDDISGEYRKLLTAFLAWGMLKKEPLLHNGRKPSARRKKK